MSMHQTEATLKAYAEQLLQRGAFGDYFSPDCSIRVLGTSLEARGAREVEQFIRYLHEQAFDANPKLLTLIVADGQAAVEASFVGTHTGEFMGVAATGRHVEVPYSVFYDFAGEAISALRIYMPLDMLMRQLGAGEAAPTVVA